MNVKKIVLIGFGSISLALGVIGVVLPVLPTTPFLLLALWCFMRSSDKLYNFILNNKHLKPYVEDYVSGNGIPRHAKIKAIILIWLTIGTSVLFFVEKAYVQVVLLLTAALVSLYIGKQKEPAEKAVKDEC